MGQGPDDYGTARWLVARAALTPVESGRKVFRIEEADRVTEEAADVLLKAVEVSPIWAALPPERSELCLCWP